MTRLPTLDLISAILDNDGARLDYTGITQLRPNTVDKAALEMGMQSALNAFPQTGCVVVDNSWEWRGISDILDASVLNSNGANAIIREFLNSGQGVHKSMVKQLIITTKTGDWLATRCHHAAMDGLSADRWLHHQLSVATGTTAPVTTRSAITPVALKEHPKPTSKSPLAHWGRSRRLWQSGHQSGSRNWLTATIPKAPQMALIKDWGRVSLNDRLGERLLTTLSDWNAQHSARTDKLALWMPTNIRANPGEGFGNGASRLRIYNDPLGNTDARQRTKKFREGVIAARNSGEWDTPTAILLPALATPLIQLHTNRPWVDMATVPFSHVPPMQSTTVDGVIATNWTIPLHRWHPAGFVIATTNDDIQITMTYDTGSLTNKEAHALLNNYRNNVTGVVKHTI